MAHIRIDAELKGLVARSPVGADPPGRKQPRGAPGAPTGADQALRLPLEGGKALVPPGRVRQRRRTDKRLRQQHKAIEL